MPMSSKFLTESTGEKIVKIDQYLVKIWTKNDSLVFWDHPVYWHSVIAVTRNKGTASQHLLFPFPRKTFSIILTQTTLLDRRSCCDRRHPVTSCRGDWQLTKKLVKLN